MPIARALPAFTLLALLACAPARPGIESLPARSLDRCGVTPPPGSFAGLDLSIAVHRATSTSRPSGGDVNGNGTVGEFRRSASTDGGDSQLAAQVAAVKSLARGVLPDARVSIVAWSGRMEAARRSRPVSSVPPQIASAFALLTSEPAEIDTALDRVLARGSLGAVDLTAAVVVGVRALREAEPPPGPRRRVMLLLSNSPTPLLGGPTLANHRTWLGGDPNDAFVRTDPDLAVAVKQAIRQGVTIHSFGLGLAAQAPAPHALSATATATGGRFRAVNDPVALDCALLTALVGGAPARSDGS